MVTKKTKDKSVTNKSEKREITRNGEEFIYIGSVPKSHTVITKELKHESGRRVEFIPGHDNWVRVYISKKFYPSLCNTDSPYHGTQTLK